MKFAKNYEESVVDEKSEILFTIKNAVRMITESNESGMITITGMTIKDEYTSQSESISYCEIHNVYLDESDTLCADLVYGRGAMNSGVNFGKSIEDLPADDLTGLLNIIYSMECPGIDYMSEAMERKNDNFSFSMVKKYINKYMKLRRDAYYY